MREQFFNFNFILGGRRFVVTYYKFRSRVRNVAKVALNTMVAPGTLEAIRGMAIGKSQGQVVDEAINALQGGDKHGEVNRWFRETWGRLDEVLKILQSTPTENSYFDLYSAAIIKQRQETPIEPSQISGVQRGSPPKNAFCKHCGNRFVGSKYATICSECKSTGHTLIPAECPICTAGAAI